MPYLLRVLLLRVELLQLGQLGILLLLLHQLGLGMGVLLGLGLLLLLGLLLGLGLLLLGLGLLLGVAQRLLLLRRLALDLRLLLLAARGLREALLALLLAAAAGGLLLQARCHVLLLHKEQLLQLLSLAVDLQTQIGQTIGLQAPISVR